MAIGIRGSTPGTASGVGDPTSLTLNGTRQPNTNDVLIIIHCNDFYLLTDMPTPTVGGSTTGVTAITTADGGTDSAHIKAWYYVVTSTADLTVAVDETSAADEGKALIAYVLTGVDTGNPIDDKLGTSAAPSTSQVAPSVSPGTSDAYLICHVNTGGGSTGGAYTEPSGMTETYDFIVNSEMSAGGAVLQLSASGATGTKTFTAGSSAGYAAMSIAVRTIAAGNVSAECAAATASANDATITTTNIRKIADRGSTQDLTAGTTTLVDIAAGASVATGNYLIARVAVDNAGASGASPTLSVSDPRSNTWNVVGPANADPGAASAGATCYIAYAKITNALSNGDDITFTYDVSPTAKAIVVEEWTNIHASSPVAVTATTATGATTTPSISRTPTATNQMFYGALAVEGPTGDTYTEDTDTTDGFWTTLTRLSTTSGTATNNQTLNGVYKVVGGTTAQTWNPTLGTARDWAQLALVFAPGVAATNCAAENAAATAAAQDATTTVLGSAENAAASAPANDATGSVAPNAENAAATSAAQDATTTVLVSADVAAATAAANDATVSTGGAATSANAENAGATGVAQDPTVTIAASAENTTAAAAALDAGVSAAPAVQVATAAAAANDATVLVGVLVAAECASATAAAQDATGRVAIGAENAAATGDALFDATGGQINLDLIADSAIETTGVAGDITAAVAPVADVAAGTASALNATVSTTGATNCNAENAVASAIANDAGLSASTAAENAAATGAAHDPTVGIGAAANVAAAAATAQDATSLIAVGSDIATAIAAAQDATVQTSGSASPAAEVAAATGAALDAGVSISTPAGVAAATAAGNDSVVAIAPAAELSAAVLAANDATVTVSGSTSVNAECAAVTASALNATVATVVLVLAEAATASVTANDAHGSIAPVIDFAAATGVAYDPTIGAQKGSGRAQITTASRGLSTVSPAARGLAEVA